MQPGEQSWGGGGGGVVEVVQEAEKRPFESRSRETMALLPLRPPHPALAWPLRQLCKHQPHKGRFERWRLLETETQRPTETPGKEPSEAPTFQQSPGECSLPTDLPSLASCHNGAHRSASCSPRTPLLQPHL